MSNIKKLKKFFGLGPTILSEEYFESRDRMFSRATAQDIMMNLDFIGTWVKDTNYKFLEISESVAQILYKKNSNYCIGKSDFCIAKEIGMDVDETVFANICRASDSYAKESKKIETFFEFISDMDGNKHLWKTIKFVKVIDGKEFICGFAIFMDVVKGSYEKAYICFEKDLPHLKKINENLYVDIS
jgi:hypothetical protein